MSTITKERVAQFIKNPLDNGLTRGEQMELARIALASLEAEERADPVAFINGAWTLVYYRPPKELGLKIGDKLFIAPPESVSVPEAEPVAYIFKHPAGRLFWSLTDESNKGQSDVMPVYSAPVPAFAPPAIEPDYEVIKGIIPTANPDEYACCIAADMWNACRAAMLQGAENSESPTTMQTAPALDSSSKIAESPSGNSPVIPDGWVACSERMPEAGDDMIVFTDDIVMSGISYSKKKGFYIQALEYDDDEPVDNVTHWMPLPTAPRQRG
ncbi:DUF551 domain-containing protein [Enterobacter ludwigii]|uniref:DUF551 domain-containing protein n=1 Tax=Enterobacter ludwigii TaxID=299767 RepID=UPI00140F0DA8|nr:DUF551 domain-containing protein [Enterobacter ludwigii]QIN37519.1 DUF551 domain-containing protein [Enterobacter ludwigii]